jgi:hypothetical protein
VSTPFGRTVASTPSDAHAAAVWPRAVGRAVRGEHVGQGRRVQGADHRHADAVGPGERDAVQAVVVDEVVVVRVVGDVLQGAFECRQGAFEVAVGVGRVRRLGRVVEDHGGQHELGRTLVEVVRPLGRDQRDAVTALAQGAHLVVHRRLEAAGEGFADRVTQRCDDDDAQRPGGAGHAVTAVTVARARSYTARWAAATS